MTTILGTVDGFRAPDRIFGWVTSEPSRPSEKLRVAVQLDGRIIGEGIADQFRQDLTPFSDGFIAYEVLLLMHVTLTDFALGRVVVSVYGSGDSRKIDIGRVFAREILDHQISRCLSSLSGAATLIPEGEAQRVISDALYVADERWREPLQDLLMAFRREPIPSSPAAKAALTPLDGESIKASEVLKQFESLGYNCEFGLVQRHFGVENIGLLRWGASWGGLPGLISGLRARFEGAGEAVGYHLLGEEYISQDNKYNLIFHTDRYRGEVDPETLVRNERLRIGYLARNLIENIEDGAKILVYKAEVDPGVADMSELLSCLRGIGPVSLLWVSVATHPELVGNVEKEGNNLFHGYIDRFSPPEHIHSYCSYGVWLEVCRNCLRQVETAKITESVG